jgi:O-antigen/teichoic acid export membrane protein
VIQVSKYSKNFITLFSGNILSQLIPFLVAPILARLYSPEEFAVAANYMAIVGVFGIVASGRLEMAIPIPASDDHAKEILWNAWGFVGITFFLSTCVIFFQNEIASLYHDETLASYLWLVPLGVLSYGLLNIFSNIQVRKRQFTLLSLGKVTQSLVNNLAAAAFGYLIWGVDGLILSWLLSQFMNAIMLMFRSNIESKNYKKFSWKRLKEYRDFPLINSLHAFTDMFATQFLLFWIITFYFGKFELGLFALMHRYVRAPITLITGSSSQLFFAEAAQHKNNNTSIHSLLKKTIFTSAVFGILFLLVTLFFGPTIFSWYLGEKWTLAGHYAQIMSPALTLLFFTSPLSTTPLIFGKQKQAFLFSLMGYVITLSLLLFTAICHWKFEDALWSYSLSFVGYYLFVLLWYIHLIRKHNARHH